ncbi:MAG TPA: hypothetical protein VGN69_05460 [Solirubrobacteraceae bacterium]|nr:hypothetical protein [Solirubrobacteraceae bacterium]
MGLAASGPPSGTLAPLASGPPTGTLALLASARPTATLALLATLAAFLVTGGDPATAAPLPRLAGPVLIALVGPPRYPPRAAPGPSLLQLFARDPALPALGLLGPTEGGYSQPQALLDLTQGNRVSRASYVPEEPPALNPVPTGVGARVPAWAAVLARARRAPSDLHPGLLAGSLPGGAAFVTSDARPGPDAVLAADRAGRIAELSSGPPGTLLSRTRAQLGRHRLVVLDAPRGPDGLVLVDRVLADRPTGELVLVVKQPPYTGPTEQLRPDLLAIAAAGLPSAPGGTSGKAGPAGAHGGPSARGGPAVAATPMGARPVALTSDSTRRDGLVDSNDVLPTVLTHLGRPVPAGVTGHPLREADATTTAASLESLAHRLRVIGDRRSPTILAFLLVWLGVILTLGAVTAVADRRGAVTGRQGALAERQGALAERQGALAERQGALAGRRGARAGLRIGGLAALWAPVTVLLSSAVDPSQGAEIAIVVGGAMVLGALSDRLLAWPRAPIAPAAVMLLAYSVDLARGSPLIARSLLGPNPIFGARFYGVGNELEASLGIVAFAGLAALLGGRAPDRRSLGAFVAVGLALTAIASAGGLGADVGAVFTIGGATAVGAVMLLPGGPSRRAVALSVAAPLAGLLLLALVDLVAGSGGHFSDSVLHAGSLSDVLRTAERKLGLAWGVLGHGLYPVETAVCLLAIAYTVRTRGRFLGPVSGAPAWRACFAGGAFGAVLGSLVNDSGPMVLVIGTVALACVGAYVKAGPRLASSDERRLARAPTRRPAGSP